MSRIQQEKKSIKKSNYWKVSGFHPVTIFADSMRWSTIQLSARTKVFNNRVNINLSGTLDPYAINANAVRINKYNGGIGRLTRVSASSGIQFSSDKERIKKKNKTTDRLRALRRIHGFRRSLEHQFGLYFQLLKKLFPESCGRGQTPVK